MPFYRYELVSTLQPETVLRRVGTLVREAPGFLQSVKESFWKRPEDAPPFIGKIEGNAFRMHRNIRYRNSFLPQVRGSVVSTPVGTTLRITMHLHPVAAVFMLVWLGAVATGALAAFTSQCESIASALIPAGMLVFGIALTVGGFYPEAFKARRLLEQAVGTGA